jgi:L-seryl-tRNA(Ser) seleniumtransferase
VLLQLREERVDAVEAGEHLEAALRRQDQIDFPACVGRERVGRPNPVRRDELTAVVFALVAVGSARDEESRVVTTGRAGGCHPAVELVQRHGVERDPGLLETLTRGGDSELVDSEFSRVLDVRGIDRAARKHRCTRSEDERGIAQDDEHVKVGQVAYDHDCCRVTDRLHGGSLRGRRNLLVVDPRRELPSVDRVIGALAHSLPHAVRVQIARQTIEAARSGKISAEAVVDAAQARALELEAQLLGPVVNATGVLLHTNLGRAPIGSDALDAATRAAGYTNIEYRLREGVRGSRHEHAGDLLARACGAEAGMVVNNNAAAVLLVLATLARGAEVVVSRGELVEIGGGFRIPEILAETGARLVEVGTTNRTRRTDYERALGDETALVLKVHASNYRMIGFVEAAPIAELTTLGLPVIVDAGSGLLDEATPWLPVHPAWLRDEPGVRQCLDAGAALVTFSGDKLLGGPQAGVIVGRRDLIDRLKAHPLARAVRADKLTLAVLQSVALAYLDGDAAASLPLWRMAMVPLDELRRRAEAIAARVPKAKVVETEAVAGGGSLPGLTIPSCGVAVEAAPAEALAARLRTARIVARVEDGRVVCDLRTVDPLDDQRLLDALV